MIQRKNVSHVVFIDSNVEDYQSLISGVSANAEVIILDETLDGIEQITERLATKQNIEAIHIISHGSPGSVQLGANTLNSSNIESFAPKLQQWRKALIPGADILLYGCNVAADVCVTTDIDYIPHISQELTPLSLCLSRLKATPDNLDNSLIGSSVDDFRDRTGVKTPGPTGVKLTKSNQFLDRLSELTGADIAASANLTGNAALGGDWELEVQIGRIETPIPFNANTLKTYSGVLGFAPKVDFPSGYGAFSLSIGDFNGDGKPDLAVANPYSSTASILLNTTPTGATTPTFATQAPFPTGASPFSVSIGDINGDGKPDLALATGSDASILLNTTATGAATPTFATKVDFPTGITSLSVRIGDFNGDTKPDLAVTNSTTDDVSILLNTTATGAPTPTFATRGDFPTGDGPRAVSIGDINGDGKPDLAVANNGSGNNNVSILLNTTTTNATTPTFATKVDFPTGTNPYGVSIGDINGDGKPDLAVANRYSNDVSILLNTTATNATTPTFAPQVPFTTGNSPIWVSIGDINGDEKPDLATANNAGNTASILLNTTATNATTPTFAPQVPFTTGTGPFSVSIGDINGDGKPDLAVANNNSNDVSILLHTTPKVTAVTATTADGSYGVGSIINITVTFDAAVTVTGTPRLQLETGTTDSFANYDSGSGTTALTFNYVVQAGDTSADLEYLATNALTLNGGTIKDNLTVDALLTLPATATANSLGGSKAIVIETVAPTVTLESTWATTVNSAFTVTATFSEDVTGFDTTDITVGNATVGNFVTVDPKTYTFDVTPTANGNVTVDVPAATATDIAGNNNTAATQLTRTYDATAPTVVLASASPTTTNAPFLVTATFSESVTGFMASDVNLTNSTISGFTGSGSNYTFTVTPNAEGPVTVDVPAAIATDIAGNNNTAATQLTRTYDATAPTVDLTSASPTSTNAPFLVTATFSESVTGFSPSEVNLTNSTISGFTGSGTTYNFTVTPNADGSVTVDIPAAIATDIAGNNNTAATQLIRTYDATAPTVALTSASPTITNAPFLVTATFSENVAGFDNTDITVTNATVGNFVTLDAKTYTFDVTPSADGNVTVDVFAATARDTAGNNNTAATGLTRTADFTAPSVTLTSNSAITVNAAFSVTATFSEDVTGFDNTDITVTNATVGNFVTLDGKTYTFDVTPSADGNVTVDVFAATARDTAGNNNTAATGLTRTADFTAPTVTLTSNSATTVNAAFSVTATFSEDVTGFDNTDITVANATVGNFVTLDAKTYTFDVTPNADGPVTVDVLASQATDTATNNNTAATQLVRTADFTAPTVALTSASATTVNAAFSVTATFSEDVTGFDNTDITVANATVGNFVRLDAKTYTFDVTPNADGPVTVDVLASQATDTATNNNTAATQLVRTADVTPPTVALTSTSPTTINAPFLVTATFSENVTGFMESDINVTNGTVSGFTGSGTTYNFIVTPNADGPVTVDVLAATARDTASNNNIAATQLTRTADVTPPTASLAAVSNIANSGGESQTLTVTFSDSSGIDVNSLDNSDLVVIWSGGAIPVVFLGVDTNSNGTTGTATYSLTGPGGSWDHTDNGSYSVNLQASQVKDTFGNQVVGSNLGSFTVNIPTPTPPPPPTPTPPLPPTPTPTPTPPPPPTPTPTPTPPPPPTPTPTPTPGTPAVIFLEPLGSTEVLESLGSDIYKVRLNTQPTANVTVDITPGSQVIVSRRALTFTPANWNVAQTVTVTAVDDAVVEGNHVTPISHATTSTDTLYNNLVAPLTVNISDNDNLGDVQTLFQKSVIGFTQNDDRITGSPLNDMIHARPGNDYLHGKAGDDLLYGQKGDDGIRGGDGNDIIFGGQGIDFISGDRGIDLIYGGKGNDRIYGGDGDDIVFGDGGNDYLFGEIGADTLTGGLGNNVFAIAIGTGSTDLAAADVITDFTLNQDKIDLISPLAFNQLNIFQGTGALVSDTIIQYQVTGEYLAILKGVAASSIVPLLTFVV